MAKKKPVKREKKEAPKCHCGRTLKTFVHECPASSNCIEIDGCPYCDDVCPECTGARDPVDED